MDFLIRVICAPPWFLFDFAMVDIHCHILPDIDDGSESWEMTAEMCRVAARDGVTHIVATPHCNEDFLYDRDRYTDMLGELHDAADGQLTFSLGCDFHFSPENIRDALTHPRRYTIGDSQYLLVEFSDYSIPPSMKQDLFSIASCGMVPIITHPERNQALLRKPEMVLAMVEQGCLVQVTANSITGFWGSRSKKMAEWLLEREAVHVVATDAHDPARRSPVLSQARDAIAALAGNEIAEALVMHNPAAIVDGRNLPYQPLSRV
jgi:protein-tyrosine phosphatase